MQSKRLKQQERSALLKDCLSSASAPAYVYEEAMKYKFLRCDQNTKNLAFQGREKGAYINACQSRNEAAEKLASFRAHAHTISIGSSAQYNSIVIHRG